MLRYNVEEDVTISVDASKTGLGAVLLQRIQPVAYASRSPTISEQNNALIEECLAVLFGCHQYAYGKEIMIENDHQPLEAFSKIPDCKNKTRMFTGRKTVPHSRCPQESSLKENTRRS